MVVYIKKQEHSKLFYKIFNILEIKKIEQKTMIFLPINERTRKKRIKKVIEKLSRYLYNNAYYNIVLDSTLMQNEIAKNILYSSNMKIIDGTRLSKFLVFKIVKKIFEYKRKNIETGEITILVNENDDVNIQNILSIAKSVKRLNIITNNTNRFKKIQEYLHNEEGILIKVTNNQNSNLRNADVIINMDYSTEEMEKITIPNEAIILNIGEKVKINSKKFSGIYIKGYELDIPEKYKLNDFEDIILYEAAMIKTSTNDIFETIENDNVIIKNLIGINGIINEKEFV